MKFLNKIISIIILLSLVFTSFVPNIALAVSDNNEENIEGSTIVAPEGYTLNNTFLEEPVKLLSDDLDVKRVLLIEDNNPWDTNANQLVLSQITSYDKVTTSEFLSVDLSKYAVVAFANDQAFYTYENYNKFKEYLELFASLGGVIVFGACDSGWAGGELIEDLPGGVTKTNHYEYLNFIADKKHPIVTGELSDGVPLLDVDLYNNYCSHISFNENSFPVGSKVILREKSTNRPTLIEYPLGEGRVIASGLTWEHNYAYGKNNGYGEFARKAMDDMFRYAIYISSINVDEIAVLQNYYLEINSHIIFVGDQSNQKPIEGVMVAVSKGGSIVEAITDENGMANIKGCSGISEVEITAPGYENYKLIYDVQPRTTRYFHITKRIDTEKPYVKMAMAKDKKYFDLRMQQLYFEEDSEIMCNIILDGEWDNNFVGKYIIYQQENSIISDTGIFYFKPGKVFKPGERIYAIMVAPDGTKSNAVEIGLLIKSKKLSFDIDKENGFRLGDNIGFTVPTDLPVIGGTDFDLELDFIPISFVKEENTVKFGIGITDAAKLKKNWNDFTQKIDEVKENVKSVKNLKKYMKAFGGKSGSFTIKREWEPELNVFGYGEGVLDEYGNITNIKGYILLDAGGKYTYNQQFVVGPVPVYFEIGGGLNLEYEGGLSKILREEGSISINSKLTITPEFTIGGGVGIVGAISVGAVGKAELPILLDFPQHYTQAKLVGSMSLKASALFIFKAEKEIAKGEWVIYENYKNNKLNSLQSIMEEEFDITDSKIYKKESRDYLDKTTKWNASNRNIALMSFGFDDSEFQVLQRWILPNTIPQIIELEDGRLIMVFQSDNANRDDNNRTTLMYSIYNNGTWNEPKAVWDNGAPDFYSTLKKQGKDVYLVWQKASKPLDDQEGMDISQQMSNVASLCEIAYAKWDDTTDSFIDTSYVTNNDTIDMLPTLSISHDEVQLVWLNNSDNSLLGDSGVNTIMTATKAENAWTTSEKILNSTKPIVNLEAHNYESDLYISYVVDLDNDLNTNEDKEVFLYTNTEEIQLTNNGLEDLVPRFQNNNLYWYSNGNIQTYNLSSKVIGKLFDKQTSVNASYKLIENANGKTSVVWILNKDINKTAINASLKTDSGWSNEFELLFRNDTIQYSDTVLDESGNWKFIINTTDFDDIEEPSSLVFGILEPKNETRLNAVYASDFERVNNIQPFEFDIENLGESKVSLLEVEVLNELDGASLFKEEISCSIEPGEISTLYLDILLPEITKENKYIVNVMGINETKNEDNSKLISLGYADVSIDVTRYDQGDKILVVAQIKNNTNTPTNVAISVVEDDIEGIVLDVKNLGAIDSRSDIVYTYFIDKDKIEFKGSDTKVYYFNIESTEKDIIESNNSALVVVDAEELIGYEGDPGDSVEIIPITGIEFESNADIELVYGVNMDQENSTYKLNIVFSPDNATYKDVKWESQDESVAIVDSEGLITAVGVGTTFIKAITYDGGYSCSIRVLVSDDLESSYLLWDSKIEVEPNKTWNIKFNTPIDESILNKAEYIYVRDSSGKIHETSLTVLDDKVTVQVIPKISYKYGETYTLYIARKLTDEKGTSLRETVKMEFTITAGL